MAFRSFLSLITVFLWVVSNGQEGSRNFYSKEFNWRIVIPEGYKLMKKKDVNNLQKEGFEKFEETYHTTAPKDLTTPIFTYKDGPVDLFEANHMPFTGKDREDFLKTTRIVGMLLYNMYKAQLPGAELDSSWRNEDVQGIPFRILRIRIVIPDLLEMYTTTYTAVIDKKVLTVNMLAGTQEKLDVLIDAMRRSTFSALPGPAQIVADPGNGQGRN